MDVFRVTFSASTKRCRSGNEDICSRIPDHAGRLQIDTAIDLKVNHPAASIDLLPQRPDLANCARNEFLASESGIDTHDQDEIDIFQNFERCRHRSRGIKGDPRFLSAGLYNLDRSMEMRPRLRMNRNDVCTCLGKGFYEIIYRRNHKVNIKRQVAVFSNGGDDFRAKGNVGDKVPVHHINMDIVGPGLCYRPYLLCQCSKIRCKN